MNYQAALIGVFATTVLTVFASAGCNDIVGNEEGSLRATLQSQPEAGSPDPPGPVSPASPKGCDSGEKTCYGRCVATNETATGCGDTSCSSCDPKNVSRSTCLGTGTGFSCGFDTCAPGFKSCDKNINNGCETSLNTGASCGDCDVTCAQDKFCDETNGKYTCTGDCGTKAKCGAACVDTTTSVLNCGGCGLKRERNSAVAKCTDSKCSYACTPTTHACGELCLDNASPASCGSSCQPCLAPPNAVATCSGNACHFDCIAPFRDCDGDPKNGCEVSGDTCSSPIICGNTKCNPLTEQCCDGVCAANGRRCSIVIIDLPPANPNE